MTKKVSPNSPLSSKSFSKGLVQVYTGNGKGKTTAALGTVIRALGYGLNVFIVVFMKGDYPYNEWKFLSNVPNVKIARFGFKTFTDPANIKPEEIEQARKALAVAREAMLSGKYNMVVLDEVNVAVAWKLAELDEVIRLLYGIPPPIVQRSGSL